MGDFGSLSSLGIGSGVLTADVIDKLKNADKEIMVKPIETKLNLIKKKEKALSEFQSIGAIVKGDILDLASGAVFAKVNTNISGSSVSVTANDGVKPQNFNINVNQLAQNDVYESKGFANSDTIINTSGGDKTLAIGVGDVTSTITLKSGATLDDLKNAINNADIGITASIIDTGIGDNPYKLILKADDTGADNIIKFNYSGIDDLGLNAINYTSAAFDSDTESVNNSGATQKFKVTVNGTEYSMDVTDGETVSDFINALNNGDLKDSEGNSLGIKTSFDNGHIKFNIEAIGDISIDDTNLLTDFNNNTDFTNTNRIQKADDADFTYNGVEIHRGSNKIEDLIPGVTINLNSTGKSTVEIKSNIDEITKSIQKFVADYNKMISNLQNLTAYDKDSGNVGLFQGESEFTTLSSDFYSDIFGVVLSDKGERADRNGNKYTTDITFTATDIGFDYNRTGMISFNTDKFKEAYNKNPDLVERFTTTAFTRLKTDFESKITNDHSSLNLLNQELKDDEKRYKDRIKAMNKFLETKYEIMAKQFSAYDKMINEFNAKSQSLTMMIQQALNSKNK
ncbi:flagellar hook-associated protein 2 [Lebetimonas natsushimae]|uniref:Flagellar hook-associated protein 2 n=1 Tax=Lebetimonas natsushimae TaxID=1936991 RepID=A0A292YCQ0_9BACT|nr:flagellar filament capping protein FliD [Lebetimonas natsushimae]GAX87221.1 flagellar hook-associated protein 2 [Lebetimonas natsushimae]